MNPAICVCLALLAAAVDLRAIQDPKKSEDAKSVITMTGCVDGSWLQVQHSDSAGSSTARYKLRGPKLLLKELTTQQKGRLVEVTGTVTDTGNTVHRGKTIDVGQKTRIHVGSKDVPQIPSGVDPSIEVDSYRILKPSCK
jgi:hypothetical protein